MRQSTYELFPGRDVIFVVRSRAMDVELFHVDVLHQNVSLQLASWSEHRKSGHLAARNGTVRLAHDELRYRGTVR